MMAMLSSTAHAREEVPHAVVTLNGHNFTLPEGFHIELAAAAPLVNRPITADFDEQGRLYVSDSSGSNDPVQKQLAEKPHRILRLEDSDGDGRFDKSTVFADKLMFPEGTLWYDGSLYVAAPPSIWKLTDTDGDGVSDRREEWFQGKTLTGCANDLHGPYLGPDGWIYWCKGAFAEQTYERPGRPPFVTKASHIFRCRPDGTGIEPVMTGGMDNPVDVVFTPGGERIFTTTFLVHPGGGLRDGLIHAVYGGVYGKVHGVLDGHPRTSPDVMPVLAHLGPAAPCGLTRYESDVFGKEHQDNLFAALFNMQKVTRHVLSEDGATFASRNEDFVVSDNRDFHPTDVLEDADGSLVIVDTGGWYKLCCPTSQLVKPDILGGIYRVRRRDAKPVNDPRGLSLAWSDAPTRDLVERLADRRPAVQHRTIHTLASRGPGAVAELDKIVQSRAGDAPDIRRVLNAVWTLTRIGDESARAALRNALYRHDTIVRHNPVVCQAVINSLSVLRDTAAWSSLMYQLQNGTLPNRRAAAEALGRLDYVKEAPILRGETVGDLMSHLYAVSLAQGPSSDRVLEHSLIYALIEIADPQATIGDLESNRPLVQRAALIALDQMPDGGLTAHRVTRFLSVSDRELRRSAAWILGRHPEWADELADYLAARLGDEGLSADDCAELANQLGTFAESAKIQDLLATRLGAKDASTAERRTVLAAMRQTSLKKAPAGWISALAGVISLENQTLTMDAVAAIRALPMEKAAAAPVVHALTSIAADPLFPILSESERLAALAAVPGGLENVSATTFDVLVEQLKPDAAARNRATAVEVLSKAKLTAEQLAVVSTKLPEVGPLEVDRLLAAFEQTTDAEVGFKLLAALDDPIVLASLRVETLKPRLAKYPAAVQAEAEKIYTRLSAELAGQRARLEEMIESSPPGDIRRGQAIFNSAKAACATCHAIGYLGGRLGPDLTRIGQVRNQRDLMESIVFPSASFVRSYEPVAVVTVDGLSFNGLLRKDAADEVVLVKSPTEEIHIARDNVEDIRPGSVSIMPQGLDKQLTAQELADLVAFLQGCK